MKLLLDTHVWLWTLLSPERIAPSALASLSSHDNDLYLSAASAWEIAIKFSLGKLPLPEVPGHFVPNRLVRDGIAPLPVGFEHALRVGELPPHHRDPFDRLLVAQALCEGMVFVTADKQIASYDVQLIEAW